MSTTENTSSPQLDPFAEDAVAFVAGNTMQVIEDHTRKSSLGEAVNFKVGDTMTIQRITNTVLLLKKSGSPIATAAPSADM